jgi:hypothetical protein
MSRMLFFTLEIDQDVVNKGNENLSSFGMNTNSIRYVKCTGALVSPNDIKILI